MPGVALTIARTRPGVLGHRFDRRDRDRVVIAERLHQPHRQRLVLTRARCHLRGVHGLTAALLQRRQRIERTRQVDRVEAANLGLIGDLRRVGVFHVGGGLERHGVEAADRFERAGQFRVECGRRRQCARGDRLRGGVLRLRRRRGLIRFRGSRDVGGHRFERGVDVARQRRQRLIEFRFRDDRRVVLRLIRGLRGIVGRVRASRRSGPGLFHLRRRIRHRHNGGEQRGGKAAVGFGWQENSRKTPLYARGSRYFRYTPVPQRAALQRVALHCNAECARLRWHRGAPVPRGHTKVAKRQRRERA